MIGPPPGRLDVAYTCGVLKRLVWMVAALALLAASDRTWGQDPEEFAPAAQDPAADTDVIVGDRALGPSQRGAKQFGFGGVYRRGDIIGVCIELTANPQGALEDVTSAWVQWEVPNADGDIVEYGRPVTLTKGQTREYWLYGRLPNNASTNSVWPVRVYEYDDGRRGRELGGLRLSPPAGMSVEPMVSLVGVVGRDQLGLASLRRTQASGLIVYTSHDDTRAVFGIRPSDFPDAWEGLSPYEAIAWSGALPADLSSVQADALREWVRRGGHLIISLPEDTNPWGLGESGVSVFEDIMPRTTPRKDEEVLLSELLPVLSKERELPQRTNPIDGLLSVRVFAEYEVPEKKDPNRPPPPPTYSFNAMDNQYEPLMALPDGRVVVIQRLFGHGRITISGIDLTHNRLSSRPLENEVVSNMPQADVFWNRILGRRADVPLGGELRSLESSDMLTRSPPNEQTLGTGAEIRPSINMTGTAGKGLLLALFLFAAYWMIAGPLGFAVLKHYKRVQHAWVAFAAAAGVFTAIAWAGVNIIRTGDVSVQHLTFLDHIAWDGNADGGDADPQFLRGIGWFSVYMPGYRDTAIGIESEGRLGSVKAQRDLLVSWKPRRDAPQEFPNPARYAIDVSRDPDDYEMPSRATVTQLYAHWLGGVEAEWGGLLREHPDDPVRVVADPATGQPTIRGTLVNDLPGELTDLKILWVRNSRSPRRLYAIKEGRTEPYVPRLRSGLILNRGRMWAPGERVAPGGNLSVALPANQPLPTLEIERNMYEMYVRRFESPDLLPQRQLTEGRQREFLEMLSFYHQLRRRPT